MNILITGVAGFIGFSLANNLLKENDKIKVYGLDNYDDYYSKKIKNLRIKELNKFKKFTFFKINICNRNLLKKNLKKKSLTTLYISQRKQELGFRLYSQENILILISLGLLTYSTLF